VQEGQSLKARTLESLAELLTTTDGGNLNMGRVLLCCDTMLLASNWSSVCCQHIVHQGAVPVLFGLIDSLNRSLPHLKLLALSLKVSHNIVRFGVDDNKVFQQPQYIATLFSLLKMHVERPEVFEVVCDILHSICANKVSGRLFVRVISQNKKLVERFSQMYDAIKHKVIALDTNTKRDLTRTCIQVRVEKEYLERKAAERDLLMIENGVLDQPKTIVSAQECKSYASYKAMQRCRAVLLPDENAKPASQKK
jgi:hypothetical protein